MASQSISQTKPRAPVARKDHRHPQRPVIQGTSQGVIMAPTLVPALKIPVASARSRLGNHSAIVLMLAGNTPASPKPSEARAIKKERKEFAAACAMDAKLQKTIAAA